MMILFERKLYYVTKDLDTRTARGRAERSGIRPTNPLAFSLNVLYSEMSRISVNELCFEPAKNLDSGV